MSLPTPWSLPVRRALAVVLALSATACVCSTVVVLLRPAPGHVDPLLIVVVGLGLAWGCSALPLSGWFALLSPASRSTAGGRTARVSIRARAVPRTAALLVLTGLFVFLPPVRPHFGHLFLAFPLLVSSFGVAWLAWQLPDPRAPREPVERRPFPEGTFARRMLVTFVSATFAALFWTEWTFRQRVDANGDAIGALCFVVVAAGALWLSQFSSVPVSSPPADSPLYAVADGRELAKEIALWLGLIAGGAIVSIACPPQQVASLQFALTLALVLFPGVRAALREDAPERVCAC